MTNPLSFFKDLGLRKKLIVGYAAVFAISIAISGYVGLRHTVGLIEKNAEKRLQEATRAMSQLLKTAATVSIRNYLGGQAEQIIGALHRIDTNTSEMGARMKAARSLLDQKIGTDGFIYCIDREGQLIFPSNRSHHPDRYAGLPIQISRGGGYLEYRGVDKAYPNGRPKADYSEVFKPWGWTIVLSVFRDELNQLVQIDDFKHIVLSYRFGKTGHAFVLDAKGNPVIHAFKPGGHNLIDPDDETSHSTVKEICRLKSGQLLYEASNTVTNRIKKRLVVFSYIPDFDWIIAADTCLEEFNEPFKTIQTVIFLMAGVSVILLLPITYWLSATITNPINELMNHFEIGIKGDLSIRTKNSSSDEIGLLANYFNSFMDQLESYSRNLQNEISERSLLEREIIKISEKEQYRIGKALHDDLCPHLIGVEALCKVLAGKLSRNAIPEISEVETVRNLISESILKARNLSKGLCPVYMGDLALESSLSDLARHTRQVLGVDCRLVQSGASVRFDQTTASNLYHIARESVLNAVKHSRASAITIKIDNNTSTTILVIEDNGEGFDTSPANWGVGLSIMKYRANDIGGKLEILSKPGQGSKLICTVNASCFSSEGVQNGHQ